MDEPGNHKVAHALGGEKYVELKVPTASVYRQILTLPEEMPRRVADEKTALCKLVSVAALEQTCADESADKKKKPPARGCKLLDLK